jgi:phosphatidylserine/phosphatidylglycerophosphate/cardiolipin synthase-like enzyme
LKQILDLLIERKKEGIDIHIILDKLPLSHKVENPVIDISPIEYLHNNNVNVSVAFRELFHYKTILIDNKFVLTGTQNFYFNSCFNHYEEFLFLEGENI